MGIVLTGPFYIVLVVEVLGLAVAGVLAYLVFRRAVHSFQLLKESQTAKRQGQKDTWEMSTSSVPGNAW